MASVSVILQCRALSGPFDFTNPFQYPFPRRFDYLSSLLIKLIRLAKIIRLKSRSKMSLQEAVTTAVSSLVDADLGHLVCHADSPLYRERIADYWSLTAQKHPYCILHPKTTEHVVQIVKILVAHPSCQFAVRSGGHIAWCASNIEDGILVDLGLYMHSVSINKDKSLVSVQPGARWRDVYKFVEPHGIAVAGGRTGGVGVAGLLTGGGISWCVLSLLTRFESIHVKY